MIRRSSRYYDGPLYQAVHKYTGVYNIVVDRKWPVSTLVKYIEHTWEYGDSFALLADKYLKDPNLWWKILEANPNIMDPFAISPGYTIRVPYGY
jgi:nucleoid-associated protein YgaU